MSDKTTNDRIATLRLIATLPGGGEIKPIEIVLCRPYQIPTGEWECLFSIEGLYEKWPPARDADAWRALMLAIKFLRLHLDGVITHGGSIRDAVSGKVVDLADIIPVKAGS